MAIMQAVGDFRKKLLASAHAGVLERIGASSSTIGVSMATISTPAAQAIAHQQTNYNQGRMDALGMASGHAGPTLAAIVEHRRLPEIPGAYYGGDQYAYADFTRDSLGVWRIESRTTKTGMVIDYNKTNTRDQLILHAGNGYLDRINSGEGIGVKRVEVAAEDKEDKIVREERYVLYTKLATRIEQVEKLLGLSGEVKNRPDDLMMALLERVEEIEAYLENRA